MVKIFGMIFASLLLAGCVLELDNTRGKLDSIVEPAEIITRKRSNDLVNLPPLDGPKIPIAVYRFPDLTGQRKATGNYASFSSAVTQGAEPFLINALQEVGKGAWFDVVERTNVDDLIKERTIIKQMRDFYEGKDAKQLPALQFACIIFEILFKKLILSL
mgnify:CR=1 FL=1